jgi:HEPN domain-containing protein
MKAGTRAWVKKAEDDFGIASRELLSRSRRSCDGICFHAQQCVEKYFKAHLCEAGKASPKTHNLLHLLDLLLKLVPEWELLRPDLHELNQYAVAFRYPGRSANIRQARSAFGICLRVRESIRLRLGLKPPRNMKPRGGRGKRSS